jgi:hypothetical protein
MSKLSKKDKSELEIILRNIQRGLRFIQSDETEIMRKTKMQSSDVFTSEYYPGERYGKSNKQCGSDLVGIEWGYNQLNSFINER